MVIRQGDRRGSGQRDALVGGPEKHIELDTRSDDGLGVTTPQLRQGLPGAEQTGIEEIGAAATGFEGEITETQRLHLQRQGHKLLLISFHQGSTEPGIVFSGGKVVYHTRSAKQGLT